MTHQEGTDAPLLDEDKIAYKDSTYEIVSKVAYLIGVPSRIFQNEYEPPKQEVYEKLERDESARIIRHLCIIRTAIERNFKRINEKMRMEYRTILSLPEYVPPESINQLNADGVKFIKKSSTLLCHHIIEINKEITNRINNCKKLFPLWINWQYIKELFLMPDGLSEDGTKEAADLYYAHFLCYPYQMYINWIPQDEGNILYNDKKFVSKLYQWHNDYFTEYSKVSDAGSYIKGSIYEFIGSSEKVVVVVDCENSDPYKLCATLKNLDYQYTQKIASIILFDDVHAASAWRILDSFTQIPVEHMMIERVKQNKSLVDVMLISRTCQEHYKNNVDSFIIVSSDSDYWGLISSLSEARFLVMVERDNCGTDLKNALLNVGVFYCYIDDFYSGNSEDIKHSALFMEMYRYIDKTVRLNINDMFDEALRNTRIELSSAEKKQFLSQYIKTMQMTIDESGDVVLKFKRT
ncbi:MAG: NYN domain-containing protein [Alphaproteobacteria bacterium]|nr:NYN domain-containing protein [Alphaproteobacteria bacterium]